MKEIPESPALTGPPGNFDPEDLPEPAPRKKKWQICSLALDVSGTCNLRCAYCAESKTMPARKPMSERVLAQSLQYLYDHLPAGTTPSIRFGSGEPLLAAGLLELADRKAKRLSEKYRLAPPQFFLTTNGTLLDKKSLQLLSEPGWNVKVSLDGPPEVHDQCRRDAKGRGTSPRAIDAVRRLFDAIGDRLSVTAVLSPGTDPACVFEFCESLQVGQIELLPVAEAGGHSSFTDDDLRRYQSCVAAYARDLAAGRRRAALSRFSNMIPRAMGFASQSYRCGAGRSLYATGPTGGLYPCFRMIGVKAFEIGSVFTGIDGRKLSRFRQTVGRSILKRSVCATCWARSLCNGPCFALVGLMNLHPAEGSIQCAYSRIDAAEVIKMVFALQKSHPERLLNFLSADIAEIQ